MSDRETPAITAGWFRAMRTTLGLSIGQMSRILDVREDTIRKAWEGGEAPIPPGVRAEVADLIEYTRLVAEYITARAARVDDPCIIVYRRYSEVPNGHVAGFFGLEWWARVAYNAASADGEQSMMVGTMDEVADWLDEPEDVTVEDLHDRLNILSMYVLDPPSGLPGLTHGKP